MKVLRTFDHDNSTFEIQAVSPDGIWKVRVLCDGEQIGDFATVSDEVVADARAHGVDVLEVAADEMERLVRSIYDLRVGKYR